mmetsp:Transcript_16178/g.39124  ORF Transcript_16178/g.39124 Transcript_16178/m.39124 type:complete len:243 (-) Transcript_16178:21-749(-)
MSMLRRWVHLHPVWSAAILFLPTLLRLFFILPVECGHGAQAFLLARKCIHVIRLFPVRAECWIPCQLVIFRGGGVRPSLVTTVDARGNADMAKRLQFWLAILLPILHGAVGVHHHRPMRSNHLSPLQRCISRTARQRLVRHLIFSPGVPPQPSLSQGASGWLQRLVPVQHMLLLHLCSEHNGTLVRGNGSAGALRRRAPHLRGCLGSQSGPVFSHLLALFFSAWMLGLPISNSCRYNGSKNS